MKIDEASQQENIYTVSRFNEEVRFLLEDTFPAVWVEGEISNFAAPQSGHWYFSLKDAAAQVRCAMFRGNQRGIPFTPKDGMHVLIRARASLYPNRGDFQLIADIMEERGEGKLRREFEQLKKKLEAAGLFAPEHKKPLPAFPVHIGVITSPTGAAIRDILNVLKRRYPFASVIIYPAIVQGKTAAPTIVAALETANARNECDVLILARGGGSLEDLWPFNEEVVAKAIYKSQIPIISGIGHEVDFTIADFVADVRAPTPSAAAELATPDKNELLPLLARQQQQVLRSIQQKLSNARQQLGWADKHLAQQHPKRQLTEKMQRLDLLEMTLTQLQYRAFNQRQTRLNTLENRLHREMPTKLIASASNQTSLLRQQLDNVITAQLARQQTLLANAAAKLDGLSPLATLQRGYAIAINKDNQILRSAKDTRAGDKIGVKLHEGALSCVIENITE